MIEDGQLEAFRESRYAGWKGELGRMIHAPETALSAIAEHAIQSNREPEPKSGRQEWCEDQVNQF
jgi:xylose isomerase